MGFYSDCSLEDIKNALWDVYNYYDIYLKQAQDGPEWVSQYCLQKIKNKYLSLIKPTCVLLGDKNVITEDYLMTTSEKLYKKYRALQKHQKND